MIPTRYNDDGTLDTSFGSGNGYVVIDFGTGSAVPTRMAAMTVGSTQMIVIGGSYDGQFALARVAASDGVLDSGFDSDGDNDGNGMITTAVGTWASVADVLIDGSNNIVAVGTATQSSYDRLALARYASSGELDTTFGTGGTVVTTSISGAAEGYAGAITSGGEILVAGDNSNGRYNGIVAEYTSSGSLDTSFGASGVTVIASGSATSLRALALDGDGNIIVAGASTEVDGQDMAIFRLTSAGALDTTFGVGGRAITNFAGYTSATALAVQDDGTIIAAGTARPVGYTWALMRVQINPDGTMDGTFGDGGKVTTDIYNNWATSIALEDGEDGERVLMVGSINGEDFGMARYLVGGQNQRFYVQEDANFNVTAIVSGQGAVAGQVAERYLSDPYGNVQVLWANWYPAQHAGEQFRVAILPSGPAL